MERAKNTSEDKYIGSVAFLGILIAIMLIMLSGCHDNCQGPTFTAFQPVFVQPSEVMDVAKLTVPQPISQPGKLYFKDGYVFINEVDKGIHVINNIDPANPVKTSFIDLPGNKDLAAKGDYLYADNYLDLVILDISDKDDIHEINRVKDVFDSYYWLDAEMGLMVATEEVEVEYEDCEGNPLDIPDHIWWGWWGRNCNGCEFALATDASSGGSAGVGGSMARFTIADDYLYTVNDWRMRIFDIEIGDSPIKGEDVDLGWGIETIFPYRDKLFLGARSGMHIYDRSDPALPAYVSSYEHINTCDPVVVQDDLAYVTLRSGTECQTFTNQLDVIDISDIQNPSLVSTFDMQNPHGLGIIGDCLFITEGEHGLKLFNAADPLTIGDNLIHHHKNVNATDVIPLDHVLMMIGEDGLHQYNYDCESELELISTIGF